MIRIASNDFIPIKQVTNVRMIADAIEKSDVFKGLLRIYFTYPVTSTTAKRSFSSLRRIKMYLRSTMTNCKLNNLFLLYIRNDRTEMIFLPTCIVQPYFKWTDVNTENLTKLFERFPCLYDTTKKEYHDHNKKKSAHGSISASLFITGKYTYINVCCEYLLLVYARIGVSIKSFVFRRCGLINVIYDQGKSKNKIN